MEPSRRQFTVLAGALGLTALGAPACAREVSGGEQAAAPVPTEPAREVIDLSGIEARRSGRMGFAIQDVQAGRWLGWRAEERFVYCSTFKMFLAAATLLRVQAGDEQLDRPVAVTQADMISHAPVTETAVGSALTVDRLMQATVEVSDNPAANILIRELGGLEALSAFYRGIGDQTTRVDRLEPEMNRLDGDKDTILPAQAVANLAALFVEEGTPLTAPSRELLLRWMTDTPTGPGRIRAGAPSGWRVAHKTGTGGYGPVNDIGLIYPPSGAPIVLAAYFHGAAGSTPDDREAAIADATRQALEALGHV